jgi:DNA-binding NarL/FixJ family response regulator
MPKIGFIDEDAGQRSSFYYAFSRDFDVYIFEPSEDSTEEELIQEAFDNQVDILIIDFQMNEFLRFNGDSVDRKLREINPYFPVIVLTSHEDDAVSQVDDVRIMYGKEILDKDSPPEKLKTFKKKILALINSYDSEIKDAEEKLRGLEEKRITVGLEPFEEQKYIEVNNFLGKVFGNGEYLSGAFYSIETNKKLDKLIEKTEQLLAKISEE